MSHLNELIDKRRALAAQISGVDLEICMAMGDRAGAQRHLKEMHAQVEARRAAVVTAGCFFVAQGDADRAVMEGIHA